MIKDRKYKVINSDTGNTVSFNTTAPALEWGQRMSFSQGCKYIVMRKGFYFGSFENGILELN